MLKRNIRALTCVGAMLCATVSFAQTCPEAVNGTYAYTAIGAGVPGALITGESVAFTPAYSDTPVGQLLSGVNNSRPFSSSGTLFFDATGGVTAKSAVQDGTTMSVGSYIVNADCTIAVALTDAFGSNGTVTTLQGVILSNGREIDLGALGDTSPTTSGSPGFAVGTFQSNALITLVRPLATYCTPANLNGPYFLVASGTRVAPMGVGSLTEASFFLFGRAQFDGNGTILSETGSQSTLNYLQFAGSYTVASDCTGTVMLSNGLASPSDTSIPNPSLSADFVLTLPTASSSRATITFTMSNGSQTLTGTGQPQQ